MQHGWRIRARWAVATWLIGVAGLIVYPPMQIAQWVPPDDDTRTSKYSGFPPPARDPDTGERVWDARTCGCIWTDRDLNDWVPVHSRYFRPHGQRLLIELALWTVAVLIGVQLSRGIATWPGPSLTGVRWSALVVAGFAVANLGLPIVIGGLKFSWIWQDVVDGELRRAAESCWDGLACWGYGFLLPYAVGVWATTAFIAWRLCPRPPAENAETGPAIAWVSRITPWPAER